jgi:tRNA 2-selenouridine synthase
MKIDDYRSLFLQDTPLIDVRAPIEFSQGALPGACNFPILNDEERAVVGTTYKEKGSAAATELGYQLVSGEVKSIRLKGWSQFIQEHPQAILYCFRGGQRSQITQRWLKEEEGIDRPLIEGGYKAVRQFLTDETDRVAGKASWLVVSGPTGSGKTEMVKQFLRTHSVDLEHLARHRGSAFGAMDEAQPTQINFENQLAVELLKVENRFPDPLSILVEDESRMIGSRYLPASVFDKIRSSPVIWVDDPIENRTTRILREYVTEPIQKDDSDGIRTFAKFQRAVQAIERRLGGVRAQEILRDLKDAELVYQSSGDLQPNRVWIEKLLNYYYDPLYLRSLDRRQVQVAFRGSFSDCRSFISGHLDQFI